MPWRTRSSRATNTAGAVGKSMSAAHIGKHTRIGIRVPLLRRAATARHKLIKDRGHSTPSACLLPHVYSSDSWQRHHVLVQDNFTDFVRTNGAEIGFFAAGDAPVYRCLYALLYSKHKSHPSSRRQFSSTRSVAKHSGCVPLIKQRLSSGSSSAIPDTRHPEWSHRPSRFRSSASLDASTAFRISIFRAPSNA